MMEKYTFHKGCLNLVYLLENDDAVIQGFSPSKEALYSNMKLLNRYCYYYTLGNYIILLGFILSEFKYFIIIAYVEFMK